MDDGHSELSSSTGGSPGVEGDSGISPDMDDSLSCDRIAAIQDKDMAVIVQVKRLTFCRTTISLSRRFILQVSQPRYQQVDYNYRPTLSNS